MGGDNCKCADCWKVYCDEKEAKMDVCEAEKCQEMYFLLDEGKVSGSYSGSLKGCF